MPADSPRTAVPVTESLWLTTQPDPVLAFLHPAPAGAWRSTAVVISPPFGWEEVCSYRARKEWAQALAQDGFTAARFDLPSTGDSGGTPEDPDRLEAWTRSLEDVAGWARSASGATRVVALGIGFGGMLACLAAGRGEAIDDLILWATPSQGSRWLRELRAHARLVVAADGVDTAASEPPDGALELLGFVLSPQTVSAVEGVKLAELPLSVPPGRRALLLGRDAFGVDQRLRDHLEAAGFAVTARESHEYEALMAGPQEARTPAATIATSLEWLRETSGSGRSPAAGHAVAPGEHSVATSARLRHGATEICETPVALSVDGRRVFAAVSEPAGGRGTLTAVFLNGGAIRHTGPNRAWVEAGRRWAARGVTTVRIDLPGIGESDGAEQDQLSNASLYSPLRSQQAQEILSELTDQGFPDRFVVGGLCSGAYWALHLALADPRVRGALMINLFSFRWSQELVDERRTRAMLSALRGRGLRRMTQTHPFTSEQIRKALRSISPSQLRASRDSVEAGQATEIEAALDTLRDRRTHALLLLSRGEPLYAQLERQGVTRQLERWPNLRIEQIPSSDHMFRAIELQRIVHRELDTALARVLSARAS